jgi:hypothetical protein
LRKSSESNGTRRTIFSDDSFAAVESPCRKRFKASLLLVAP